MELSKIGNVISKTAVTAPIMGGVGYLVCRVFTSINPLLGLTAGFAYNVGDRALRPFFNTDKSDELAQVIGQLAKNFFAIGAAIAVRDLIGFSAIEGALESTVTAIAANPTLLIVFTAITILGIYQNSPATPAKSKKRNTRDEKF